MKGMIGYCGYNCHLCAARSEDPVVRQKLVDGWKKYLGHQHYTADNVKCDGCRSEGQVADKACPVRPCAKAKGMDSCVDCNEFPCKSMKNLVCSKEGFFFFHYPKIASLTQQEYNLSIRQFESLTNLIQRMVEKNKLPSWIKGLFP